MQVVATKHVSYLFVSLALLLGTQIASAQETERYSGTGRAILGTSMTLEQTEQLALNAAKRDALEQFGTHVQSETTWQTEDVEGEDEFRRDLRVFAASVVQLVEDTKTIEREPTEETIRIVANADFDVDVSRFNERLEQYLDNPDAEDLESMVDQYTQIDSQIQSEGDPDRAYSLYQDQQGVKENIEDAFQRLDGGGMFADIEQVRARKIALIEEQIETIQSRGYISDLVDVSLNRVGMRDEGNVILEYEISLEWKEGAHEFARDLRGLVTRWYENSDTWPGYEAVRDLRRRFNILLVGLDEDDRVVFVDVPHPYPMTVVYGMASPSGAGTQLASLPSHDAEVRVPRRFLRDVVEVGVIFADRFYPSLTSNGYTTRSRRYPGDRPSTHYPEGRYGQLTVDDLRISREEFASYYDNYIDEL